MGGHRPDLALWWDGKVFSTYKDNTKPLPQALPRINAAVTDEIAHPSMLPVPAQCRNREESVVISDKVSDIRIEADDNLIDLVVVRAVKGKLEATLDQKVNNIQNGNVTITVPANGKIRSLDASSASKIIGEHGTHYPLYSIRQYTFNNIKQDNRNMLLGRDPAVDGMKTGYTDAAGYCLVATSKREFPGVGQRRLLSIVLGTASENARANESQKLLNWGYTAWDAVRLFEGGKAVATVPVWKGQAPTAALGAQQPVLVTVPKGEGDKLKTAVARTDPLVAPLTQGQKVGSIEVTTSTGTKLASVPLVVLQAVPEAGLLGRAWDSIRLWIK